MQFTGLTAAGFGLGLGSSIAFTGGAATTMAALNNDEITTTRTIVAAGAATVMLAGMLGIATSITNPDRMEARAAAQAIDAVEEVVEPAITYSATLRDLGVDAAVIAGEAAEVRTAATSHLAETVRSMSGGARLGVAAGLLGAGLIVVLT